MTSRRLTRGDVLWLVGCQWLLALPHLPNVPYWVPALVMLAGLWRLAIAQNRVPLPGWPVRVALAITALPAMMWSFGTLVGLEPMVALLLVASALKTLEMRWIREAYLLLCLGFFMAATHLIYYQSLPVSLYVLANVVLLLLALVRLNRSGDAAVQRREIALVMRMLGWSAPLMLLLFLVFPRIEPLWAVPSLGGAAVTGMSDRLSPGSVAKLARSDEVAFRARFEGETPSRSSLYWRGIVLDQFKEGEWSPTPWMWIPAEERAVEAPTIGADAVRYDILQPPTQQHWLFTLPFASSADQRIAATPTFHLVARQPIERAINVSVASNLSQVRQPELSAWWRQHELRLPPDSNPRTRKWVRQLREVHPADEDFIRQSLSWFGSEPFFYTLSPPALADEHFVDQFLFDSRRGFCEHYAYAFVVMMRMAGIPARIVVGYQGGESNPQTGTLVIRQLDAHAWAEVWLPRSGWLRIDPTAAVAPERIEGGLESAVDDAADWLGEGVFSAYRFRGVPLVDWLRWQYDDLAWRWQKWVVGFDNRRELEALDVWLEKAAGVGVAAAVSVIWMLALLLLYQLANRTPASHSSRASERAFLALCRRLQRRGILRGRGESAAALLPRAQMVLGAEDPLARELERVFKALYQRPALR